MSGLPATTGFTLITEWRINWVPLVLAVAVAGWYLAMRRRVIAAGLGWAGTRTALFLSGLGLYLWCTNGFLNAYASTLFWVWAIQILALLLLIPLLIMGGHPVELATRTARRRSLLELVSSWPPARLVTHPFVGLAVVPITTAFVFFGHVAHLWTGHTLAGVGIGLLLVGLGCLIAMPLTVQDRNTTSLVVGAVLAVSVLELLTDAIPGIVLRLSTHPASGYFATRHALWAMTPLSDQKLAGAILWGVAEMLDLPILAILFLRWVRTDEREARHAALALEHAPPHTGNTAPDEHFDGRPPADPPWWLTDPQLSTRPGLAPRATEDDARS